MLDIDSSGICPREVSYQFLERRRILKWILLQNLQQCLRFEPKPRRGELLCVFLRLLGIDQPPGYQASFLESFLMGVCRPFRMDSRIPGMETR